MPSRIPLPDALRARSFSVSDPSASILTPGRLRGPDLEAPFRGVRAPTGSLGPTLERARALATRMPRHAFFSHLTAALLHGIPLPPRLDPTWRGIRPIPLDVSVPMGTVPATGRGIRSHRIRIDESDVVELGGLRITSRARTWCDLAAHLSDEDLIAAGDHLLWRKHPAWLRLSRVDLVFALKRFEGRRGRPALRRAEPRLTDHSDSPPESIIRVRVIDAGLPEPDINVELFDRWGTFLARPDLSWRRFGTTFDYEGDGHRIDAEQWERDIARVPRLENAGYAHVRGSRADLHNSTDLIANLTRRLRDRGWIPGTDSR